MVNNSTALPGTENTPLVGSIPIGVAYFMLGMTFIAVNALVESVLKRCELTYATVLLMRSQCWANIICKYEEFSERFGVFFEGFYIDRPAKLAKYQTVILAITVMPADV